MLLAQSHTVAPGALGCPALVLHRSCPGSGGFWKSQPSWPCSGYFPSSSFCLPAVSILELPPPQCVCTLRGFQLPLGQKQNSLKALPSVWVSPIGLSPRFLPFFFTYLRPSVDECSPSRAVHTFLYMRVLVSVHLGRSSQMSPSAQLSPDQDTSRRVSCSCRHISPVWPSL